VKVWDRSQRDLDERADKLKEKERALWEETMQTGDQLQRDVHYLNKYFQDNFGVAVPVVSPPPSPPAALSQCKMDNYILYRVNGFGWFR
jgi:hypothetical protein